MEQTLHALGGLLLNAVPTFLLVVVLHFYLKYVFFAPLEKVLQARHEATEGARRQAEASLALAGEKAAEFEAAIRAARAEIYREQEEARQRWRQEHAEAIAKARPEAERLVKDATVQLAVELADAQRAMAKECEALSFKIVDAVLTGKAA